MGTVLLVLVIVLVVAGLVYGVVSLLSGDDPGLEPAEPDGRARPLPNNRSLTEYDLKTVRFDVGLRGYRMTQVDRVLRRTAYDVGYKDEMIAVLEAEVIALREGRTEDAELLRKARESAAAPSPGTPPPGAPSLLTESEGAPSPGDGARGGGAHRGDGARGGGAHRAGGVAPLDDEPEAGVSGVSGVSAASDASGVSAASAASDDETFTATAPGRLNRAALRSVTVAEPAPVGAADPDAAPAAAPDAAAVAEVAAAEELDPRAEAAEPEQDSDVGAERGARA